MTIALSIVIPAHNPRMDYLERVLDALRAQSLPQQYWELLVVDNQSDPPLSGSIDLRWHSRAFLIREEKLGLTCARVRGFKESLGKIIVLVDDDNILHFDYLEQVSRISKGYPYLGSWSGRVQLELENPEKPPPHQLRHLLCEREVKSITWSNDPAHVVATPWGAGMCIHREVALAYVAKVAEEPRRQRLDLQGREMVYGGDTDIAYFGCAMGLGMGIFPELKVIHLIPEHRCATEYLLKNLEAHAYSEILHHWVVTGTLTVPRADWLGRIGHFSRWVTAGSVDRKIMAAKARGYARARRELAIEDSRNSALLPNALTHSIPSGRVNS
jgi:glycosyltransferase involved in cell wall biosynthesis